MHGRIIKWVCLVLLILSAPGSEAQEWKIHKVARGENLTIIARRYDVTVADRREWNRLSSDRITIGQQLRIPSPNQEIYVVKAGDNLTEISRRYDIPLPLLRQLNGLQNSRIHPGQQLKLRPAPGDEAVHVVQRGESLSEIAALRGLTVASLQRINDLTGTRIYVGQKLRLKEADPTRHIVESGDALWEIAKGYGISVTELKRINGLRSDRIYPGQELLLTADATMRLGSYKVQKGDNLTEIARLHQMTLRELRDLNGLRGSVIHPGQVLKVRPLLGLGGMTTDRLTPQGIDWSLFDVSVPGVRRLPAANGPYFFERPRASAQKSLHYFEKSQITPKLAYRNAQKLWTQFEKTVAGMGRLSNRLEGWHFVLDPGHGGIDPGTIVKAKDADGQVYYIVEDEYVYDIALRVYVLLKLHGAEVTLTLLSSNHLLRQNSPVTSTFVHDRNEVFNNPAWNNGSSNKLFPKGGQKYLDARIEVTKQAFNNVPANRQVFLSFHADNVAALGDVVTLFYFKNSRRHDHASREFAGKLLPALGAGARMSGKDLGVLRGNPARYKLLVEMRNLAFEDHIWAIRYDKLRQRDAEKVVKALLDGLTGD
jgi:LysM repeat protein